MAERKKILCLVGSLNQTTQLHKITKFLEEDYDVYFSQIFGEGLFFKLIAESGMLDNTVLGKNSSFTKKSKEYILQQELKYDYRGNTKNLKYDLTILSTDLIIPESVLNTKSVWVQEGMIDPISSIDKLIRKTHLPRYINGNTSLNGTSNIPDLFFAMSKGYKEYFNNLGTDASKILVTGVPNFDNIKNFLNDTYPEKDFVLVATSDIRELGGNDNRTEFLKNCIKIANGKKIIFKPHPNENIERVIQEINQLIPNATIVTEPILDTLIAHCDTLITQYSSSVYVGLLLEKKIYSYFPIEKLKANQPIQNQGESAEIIADICREYIEWQGDKKEYLLQSKKTQQYL